MARSVARGRTFRDQILGRKFDWNSKESGWSYVKSIVVWVARRFTYIVKVLFFSHD